MNDNDALPRGTRGRYANLICSACRARKIKCRLPSARGKIQPSTSPRPPAEACERCRRLELPCVVPQARCKRQTPGRRHVESRGSAGSTPSAQHDHASGAVKPAFFEQYYARDGHSIGPSVGSASQRKDRSNASEAFRAMMTSANLLSTLLTHESSFGSSISCSSTPGPAPLTDTISNGLATLLDESLVWHRFFLPFLPTLTSLRSLLASAMPASSSTSLLFGLLALCALESPSSELYWHRELRQNLQKFVSYHAQEFLYDPPIHRHTVYVLQLVIAYKPTALIACQQSASGAVRGTTHVMLAYSTAKKCGIESAASSLADLAHATNIVREDETTMKIFDALLWCRCVIYDILLEGSIVKSLSEMERQLDRIHKTLDNVHALLLRTSFTASGIYLFHAVRCACVEMQHYVRFRKARRDLAALAAIIEAHEELSTTQNAEILRMLSESASYAASAEESSIAASLVPMEASQSRARLLAVAIFFSIMSHMTPTNPDERIKPHEAARVSKHVFDVLKRPDSGELAGFLGRFGVTKDQAVHAVFTDFVDAGKNLILQRMPWRPSSRMSSHEILFQCWLIVDHNIGRLNEGHGAHPDVEEHLALFEQCVESLEALSTPVGCSIDHAFASGCLYAASAKLIRCLHGILLARMAPKGPSVTASMEESSLAGGPDNERSYSFSDFQNFEQNFGEWDNWPFNSTLDMVQLLQEDLFS